MRVLVASTNEKKLAELRELAKDLPIEVVSPADLDAPLPEVEEDEETFAGNASLKAVAFAKASGLPTLADDSGLCVDALGGAPGVRSARYSGEDPAPDRDQQNNDKLLRALRGIPAARRTARFVCAIALAQPSGEVEVVEGEWGGRIAFSPRGGAGFGYDPLFLIPHLGKTSAELEPAEKRARSHRGQAMRKVLPLLEAL